MSDSDNILMTGQLLGDNYNCMKIQGGTECLPTQGGNLFQEDCDQFCSDAWKWAEEEGKNPNQREINAKVMELDREGSPQSTLTHTGGLPAIDSKGSPQSTLTHTGGRPVALQRAAQTTISTPVEGAPRLLTRVDSRILHRMRISPTPDETDVEPPPRGSVRFSSESPSPISGSGVSQKGGGYTKKRKSKKRKTKKRKTKKRKTKKRKTNRKTKRNKRLRGGSTKRVAAPLENTIDASQAAAAAATRAAEAAREAARQAEAAREAARQAEAERQAEAAETLAGLSQ